MTRSLGRRISGEIKFSEPMARHTSFRIGGPVDIFCVCDTLADLTEVTRVLGEEGVPWTVVGKGTNLLVADEGYSGAVIVLGKEFARHSVEAATVKAGAGCILAYVVQDAFSRGLGGLSFAVGIPGTLGGALAMNAGSREEWIGSVVESVTVFTPESGLARVRGPAVTWGYRVTDLPARGIIVEAVLALQQADVTDIRRKMEMSLNRRKKSQPMGVASAGSVFRNPEGHSAGRLIEDVGLKGTRHGGAVFSQVHANFIVNDGGATASDVLALLRKAQMCVRDTYGIRLEPEIRFLGRFDGA
jgi:UDP-N-acetylmuramate dehydrogenase